MAAGCFDHGLHASRRQAGSREVEFLQCSGRLKQVCGVLCALEPQRIGLRPEHSGRWRIAQVEVTQFAMLPEGGTQRFGAFRADAVAGKLQRLQRAVVGQALCEGDGALVAEAIHAQVEP